MAWQSVKSLLIARSKPVVRRNLCTTSKPKISFASDNTAGVHEKVLAACSAVNVGGVTGYGEDIYTIQAVDDFKRTFGKETGVHFVANGTAANVLAYGTVSTWFNSIIASEVAHVNVDEGGAPERVFGLKVIPVPSSDGKIRPEQLLKHTLRFGDVHHSQPRVVSITQPTEYGAVYSLKEIEALSDVCQRHGLLLHMDGARIANACAALDLGLKEGTKDVGIDLMSFGGTKNGIMFGEAVLFFKPDLDKNFRHIQKQTMQMISKNRFVAAQLQALLQDDLWLKNARHANAMTATLAEGLKRFPKVVFTHETQANAVFATMPREYIDFLQEQFYFYVWDEPTNQVRLMCAFNTPLEHVHAFLDRLEMAQSRYG